MKALEANPRQYSETLANDSTREKARTLYFAGHQAESISEILDVPPTEVLQLIEQGWARAKRSMDESAIALYIWDKRQILEKTAGTAADVLTKSLTKLKGKIDSGEKELSAGEMKDITKIVTELDKISRLESGEATSIIQNQGLSVSEAREIIKQDPFLDAEEAEYRVVKERAPQKKPDLATAGEEAEDEEADVSDIENDDG